MREYRKLYKAGIAFALCLTCSITMLEMNRVSVNAGENAKTTSATNEAVMISTDTDAVISNTEFTGYWSYTADTPVTVNFWDGKGLYNVASYNSLSKALTIYRYEESLGSPVSQITINNPYAYFGDAIIDSNDNYYVVWGQNDTTDSESSVRDTVISLCKYDYSGKLLGSCNMTGPDSNPYVEWGIDGEYWGTCYPFDAGNCELAMNGDILTCNYAREMYSGHQSNYIFYVRMSTMERLYADLNTPYCSHSFDQDVIATSDGGFLYANHGDAYNRGFLISKVTSSGTQSGELCSFHFREGSNRAYGYNETYAQLGGLAETSNAYVLCGSSERTLSLETAPTNRDYCGHSEARDLFVQILKKDFYNYSDAEAYQVAGTTRTATGTSPTDALTNLYLSENTVDYGVIWLTELADTEYVCNPKVISLGENRFIVLWEERSYGSYELIHSYYEILSDDGTIVKGRTQISDTALMGNTDLTYHNECIYWVTSDTKGTRLHKMDVSEHNYVKQIKTKATCTVAGEEVYVCSDCGVEWTAGGSITIPVTDHQYVTKTSVATLKKDGKITTTCKVCGKEKSTTVISRPKTIKLSATVLAYSGKTQKPKVTVTDSAGNTVAASNYKVTYPKGCKNVGTYTVTITFKKNYSGSVKRTFTIKPKAVAISKTASVSKGFTLTWKKQTVQTSGYQIQYSTSSKLKNAKTVTVKKTTKTSLKITKLKGKKKYYVRIRTYKTVGGKNYYSAWSKVKKVTTKK